MNVIKMLKESLISNCFFTLVSFVCLYFSASLSVFFLSLISNHFTLIVPVGEFQHTVLSIRVFTVEILGCLFVVSWVNVFKKTFHVRSFMDHTKDGSGVEST